MSTLRNLLLAASGCLLVVGCDQPTSVDQQKASISTGNEKKFSARVVTPDSRYAQFLAGTQIAPNGIPTTSAFTINQTESEAPLIKDQGFFSIVQTDDEVKSMENTLASASVSGSYGAFSGEGSFSKSVNVSKSTTAKSLTMIVYRYIYGPVVNIYSASFPTAKYNLLVNDPRSFVSTYGNAYAYAASLGGWYTASYTWTEATSNSSTYEEMKAGLTLKYASIKGSISYAQQSSLDAISKKVTETSTFKSSCPNFSVATQLTPATLPNIDATFLSYYQGADADPSRWVVIGQLWKGYYNGIGPTLPQYGSAPFPTSAQFQAVNQAITMRDPAEFQVDSVGVSRNVGSQQLTLSYRSKATSAWFSAINLYYTNNGVEHFLKAVPVPLNNRDVYSVTLNLPSDLSAVYSNFGGTTFRLEPVYNSPLGVVFGRDALYRLSANRGPHLAQGEGLFPQEYLQSSNGFYRLWMQNDGNLVQYTNGGSVLWHSHRNGNGTSFLILQGDGNMVTYRSIGGYTWDTSRKGTDFWVQDDNNIVLYNGARAVWSRR